MPRAPATKTQAVSKKDTRTQNAGILLALIQVWHNCTILRNCNIYQSAPHEPAYCGALLFASVR